MKAGILIALSIALLAQGAAAAEAGVRDGGRRIWRCHTARVHYAHPSRHVYWVLRTPRVFVPPQPPELFFFEFVPTNRVNTHMY